LQSGEIMFCQGFSEPGAGSDLPALRTRATLEGDHYVVEGHKLWTTGAHYADWCLLLARTDPNSQRHHGLTCLLVEMSSPGVTARPIIMSNGVPETSEVFFDGVNVPVDQRVGAENDGWNVAMSALTAERGPESFKHIAMFPRRLQELEAVAKQRGLLDDISIRERLARAYVNGEAHRVFCLEQMSLIEEKAYQGTESSVAKLLWAEMEQDLNHLAMDITGASSVLGREPEWVDRYLHSRMATVYGGTIQMQRNALAERVLHMPRAPRPVSHNASGASRR
jgi:alkylation response protein AidB-like acyl-CoA dehydrogenase